MNEITKQKLQDILKTIATIEDYLRERKFYECHDIEVYGVIHCLQVIGEAARVLPEDFRNKHKEVDWQNIIGMRHLIVHEYFRVDLGIVEKVLDEHLPALKKQILRILEEL
ncbi:MAG: hypothetical protein A3I68_06725 [Candidatus Melainabacteria bacterium RIFCSPLOWO2_02_FULL_35_15]|nr:MAG: hypothetical protein A3I68_06725 [Candidatus Melainabacteria bacterium RIFCSPLOWO2_02_FULL_35_15]